MSHRHSPETAVAACACSTAGRSLLNVLSVQKQASDVCICYIAISSPATTVQKCPAFLTSVSVSVSRHEPAIDGLRSRSGPMISQRSYCCKQMSLLCNAATNVILLAVLISPTQVCELSSCNYCAMLVKVIVGI